MGREAFPGLSHPLQVLVGLPFVRSFFCRKPFFRRAPICYVPLASQRGVPAQSESTRLRRPGDLMAPVGSVPVPPPVSVPPLLPEQVPFNGPVLGLPRFCTKVTFYLSSSIPEFAILCLTLGASLQLWGFDSTCATASYPLISTLFGWFTGPLCTRRCSSPSFLPLQ